MPDIWMIGPTAVARALRTCGFSSREADHLVALKLRYERGAFRELTMEYKRLLFVRWLVANDRLNEGQPGFRTSPELAMKQVPRSQQ